MKHRLYKLESKFTFMGLGWLDIGIVLGTFICSIQILGLLVGPRPKLVLSLLLTAFTYFVWHFFKDKVPDKFGEHFMIWLGEPEVYRCVPDMQNMPLSVDFEGLRDSKLEARGLKAGGEVRGTISFER